MKYPDILIPVRPTPKMLPLYGGLITHLIYQYIDNVTEILDELPSCHSRYHQQVYINFIIKATTNYIRRQGKAIDDLLHKAKVNTIACRRFCVDMVQIPNFVPHLKYWWAEDLFVALFLEFYSTSKVFTDSPDAYYKAHTAVTWKLKDLGIIEPDMSLWTEKAFPFDLDRFPGIGGLPATLLVGRLQPPHRGYFAPLRHVVGCPTVALVTGKHPDRNSPFTPTLRSKMIKEVIPDAEVILAQTGYIPTVFWKMRKRHLEPVVMLARWERIADYKAQIHHLNWHLPQEKQINVVFRTIPSRGDKAYKASSSEIREALRDGNMGAYRRMMPRQLWPYWEQLVKTASREFGGVYPTPHKTPHSVNRRKSAARTE